jgi:hypothetical protein
MTNCFLKFRLMRKGLCFRAFSSEVDAGSREENAKKQKLRVISRFNQNGNCSKAMRIKNPAFSCRIEKQLYGEERILELIVQTSANNAALGFLGKVIECACSSSGTIAGSNGVILLA